MKWPIIFCLLASCVSKPEGPDLGLELRLASQDLLDIASVLDEDDDLEPYFKALGDIVIAVSTAVESEDPDVTAAVRAGFTALEGVLRETDDLSDKDRARIEAGGIVVRSVLRRIEAYS